jgi:hypothetical protein
MSNRIGLLIIATMLLPGVVGTVLLTSEPTLPTADVSATTSTVGPPQVAVIRPLAATVRSATSVARQFVQPAPPRVVVTEPELEEKPEEEPEVAPPPLIDATWLVVIGRSVDADGLELYHLRDSRSGRRYAVGSDPTGRMQLLEVRPDDLIIRDTDTDEMLRVRRTE